jgi:hypothetical protein
MIKITKPGQKEFHGFCKWCGCEFTYEISDLKLSATSDKVSCPTCGKDYYHNMMIQDPTIPGGIGRLQTWPPDPIPCTPDMTKTDPCAGCTWRERLLRDGVYVGDTPCTWCDKNKFNSTTYTQPSIKDYITPCVNQLDTHLTTSTSSELSGTKYVHNNSENQEDFVQGPVMSTIYNAGCEGLAGGQVIGNNNACHNCTSSLNKCSDTEGCNSCSGEHNGGGKKNCNGKH